MRITVLALPLACLTILLVSLCTDAQEAPEVLKPNQSLTFVLAPKQEKAFILQMKKGDFADLQWLARDDLNLSFQIYDSVKRERALLEDFYQGERTIWFVAPADGDFLLVSKFEIAEDSEIPESERVSVQYKNKFKLPLGTKQKDLRRVNGYDVKIMSTPGTDGAENGGNIVLIEKNRVLRKILNVSGGGVGSFYFPYPEYLRRADTASLTKAEIAKEMRTISLLKSTVDKTGDGVPDVMIQFFSGGAHCCFVMLFINLGETVQTAEVLGMADGQEYLPVDRSPNGGLLFFTYDLWAYWNTSFATSPGARVILEFRNGRLRPNFDLMKEPAPSLAYLRDMAEFQRQKLSLNPYRSEDDWGPPDFNDPFYKEDSYPDNQDVRYKGKVVRNVVFWGPMLDLIYSGHEDLAWQFLDLVWPPQKQGKAIFIRDFKRQLSESWYWKMILEDGQK